MVLISTVSPLPGVPVELAIMLVAGKAAVIVVRLGAAEFLSKYQVLPEPATIVVPGVIPVPDIT